MFSGVDRRIMSSPRALITCRTASSLRPSSSSVNGLSNIRDYLQPRFSTGIGAHIFDIGEFLHAHSRSLAAKPRLLRAAEGDGGTGDLGTVDGHHAELQQTSETGNARRALRVQIGDQPGLGVVGLLQHVVLTVEGRESRDRPERLLA